MALAKVAFHRVGLIGSRASNVLGACVYSETLDFSAGTDTSAALTAAQAQNRDMVARLTAMDVACSYAFGITPDPDAATETEATSAGSVVPAGGVIEFALPVGAKIAVKAL
jgi:hypothetical protein